MTLLGRVVTAATRRQAPWLTACLRAATQLTAPAIATIALPGGWIHATHCASAEAVRVSHPAARDANLMADAGTGWTIDPGTTTLITQALVMRYRVGDK